MRHPGMLIGFGFIFGVMALDGYLRYGLQDVSVWGLAFMSVLLPIIGGYIWQRYYDGSPPLIVATTGVFFVVTIAFAAHTGIGPTPLDKGTKAWVEGKLRLQVDAASKPQEVRDQYYLAKSSELDLVTWGKKELARDSLRTAVAFAKKHSVAGLGYFGTRIKPELTALIPEAHWVQTRGGTLVKF